MNLTKENMQAAVNAGLALTDPETDLLDTFRRHAPGIMVLRGVLGAINKGEIALTPVMGEDKPPPKKEQPPQK